ncbi:TRAP transporter small permease [Oceanobacter mangrovi]|uniref:TRAP transporter small permease n=1 Tax=Oceanobacter mangrovi TaxID=2862510 RepID=UPI001C8CF6DD|nr:TRAP transporter small permease [Oceanobacter mangrovi]
MTGLLSKALDRMVQALFYIGVLAGAAMALLILASALLRYLAGAPISFSDELAGLLFVTLAFTTFPYVMDRAEHIRLTILTERFGPLGQRLCRFGACLIFFTFASVFVYESWNFMDFSKMIESRSDVSGLLLWPWMALMPAAMAVCLLVELRALWRLITTGEIQTGEERI